MKLCTKSVLQCIPSITFSMFLPYFHTTAQNINSNFTYLGNTRPTEDHLNLQVGIHHLPIQVEIHPSVSLMRRLHGGSHEGWDSTLELKYHDSIITVRKRSLGQGNVFTPVCLFTGGLPLGGGLHMVGATWGACMGGRPPELGKRAIRILLECFLAYYESITR